MEYKRIPLHEECPTPFDCIKKLISQNKGTQNSIMKSDLLKLAEANGISVKGSDTKAAIFTALAEKMPLEAIAEKCNIGVSSRNIQQKFGVKNAEVKRMANKGLIRITGKEKYCRFGTTFTANLYSIFDFYRLSCADVQAWLNQHSRPAHKR